jgi:hypothetical protein
MRLFQKAIGCVTLYFLLAPNGVALAAEPGANYAVKAAYESLSLPAGESMGMLGLGVERKFNDHFSAGVGTWTAVRGERGGFITIGFQGSASVPVSGPVGLEAGAFLGAGGGRGGAILSGGGLMLRGYVGLFDEIEELGRIGAGVSYVDFPNGGTIDTVQPTLFCSIPFGSSSRQFDGLAYEQNSLAVMSKLVKVRSGSRDLSGNAQDDFTLLGIEWRSYFDDDIFLRFETAGAAGGSSTGYMQVLVGAGVQIPLSDSIWIDGSLALGGGGGGDVDTGGGFLVDALGDLRCSLGDDLFVSGGVSYLKAPNGSLSAFCPTLEVGGTFGKESRKHEKLPVRVRMVTQRYSDGADGWRTHDADKDVDNLGVQFDYFPVPWGYLTGQALAAYDGNAGAYMIGLVGGGLHQNVAGPLFVEAEGLVGAAGGGGLAMGSGLAWQINAGVGVQVSKEVALMATAGRLDAVNGPFKADVLGLSVAIGGR